jgi:hypothetical protein
MRRLRPSLQRQQDRGSLERPDPMSASFLPSTAAAFPFPAHRSVIKQVSKRRKRCATPARQSLVLLIKSLFQLVLSWRTTTSATSGAFQPFQRIKSPQQSRRDFARVSATQSADNFNNTSYVSSLTNSYSSLETWSRSQQRTIVRAGSDNNYNDNSGEATATYSESRFGVRRRVKAVLQKARSRTGVRLPYDDSAIPYNPSFLPQQNDEPLYEEYRVENLIIPRDDVVFFQSRPPKQATRKLKDEFSPSNDGGSSSDGYQLPFDLPTLSADQIQRLHQGERLQEQSKMGREGSGYVVWDLPNTTPPSVWECLLDFESYPQNIGTVRSMQMFSSTQLDKSLYAENPLELNSPLYQSNRQLRHYGIPSTSRASFILSKFRLKIAAIHNYVPALSVKNPTPNDYMIFTLDKACTNVVLQDAKGIWYTQYNPPDLASDSNVTRVWLLCYVKVSPLLPTFIVDYAARRAMPRATTWLQPAVQRYMENRD